ncbi:hypothetical protein, partial [Pseudomonas sp. NPDC007930]|uniref:hypothetical protein n=1 Tax=Pseudomonas sp. NPDC007930 TaxID=3364417 RepID=UPI0036E90057
MKRQAIALALSLIAAGSFGFQAAHAAPLAAQPQVQVAQDGADRNLNSVAQDGADRSLQTVAQDASEYNQNGV